MKGVSKIERVYLALKTKQIGQRDLARRCNVPQTEISRWIRRGAEQITIARSKELIAAYAEIRAERKQQRSKAA